MPICVKDCKYLRHINYTCEMHCTNMARKDTKVLYEYANTKKN